VSLTERCPSCGAPRLPMPACPECRAPYPAPAPDAGVRWTGEDEERVLDKRLLQIAPPAVLILGFIIVRAGVLGSLVRIFDSMWLHEIGHAVTAWLSGFAAFPGPWRTSIGETRSPALTLVLVVALGAGAYLAHRAGRRKLAVAAGVVLLLALALTLGVKPHAAQGLILFGGDAGALVLGTALFVTFFAARGSYLQVSWLRWGFLFLGGFAFADVFTVWWRARHDLEAIPFGEIEGVGHSDPTRLVDEHGWSVPQLVTRYVALGVVCLVVMAIFYVINLVARRSSDRRASP